MKKYILSSLLLSSLLAGGLAFAQTTETQTAAQVEAVTAADLGVAEPGLLPTSPFYFLKEFGRAIRRAVTLDSIKKAELELRIINAKAAELKKVEENQPQNTAAIQKAIQNYQANQQRLTEKFENLKENSSNPNVDKLLQEFADRAVKHAKVFNELETKFENNQEVAKIVGAVREKSSEVAAAAAGKDEPAKFAAKIEQVLTTAKGSDLKHIRSVEILDNFIRKAPEAARVSLEKVKEDISARLETDLKNAIQTQGAETVKRVIKDLPGSAVRRAAILKELEQKAGTAVSGVLGGAAAAINKEILSSENIMEKAQAQLQAANDALAKLSERLKDVAQPPANVKEHYEKARNAYTRAKAAFEEKNYGEAFGQSNSAEMAARNALRFLEEKIVPEADSLKAELERMEAIIAKYADLLNSRNITAESNPKVYEFLSRAKEHLSYARGAFAKDDLDSVRTHIKHIKEFLSNLSRFIEGEVRTENKVPELKEDVTPVSPPAPPVSSDTAPSICTTEYSPVCGENGKTYSNACMAKAAGATVKYRGKCAGTSTDTAPRVICTEEYSPVCGENGKTYSNACMAKAAGATVKYRGVCAGTSTDSAIPTATVAPAVKVPVPVRVDSVKTSY